MTKNCKRIVASGAIMGLMSSLVFTGCGKNDGTTGTTTVLDPEGMSYVADFYDVTDESGKKATIDKMYYEGDKIYVSAFAEGDENRSFIASINPEDMQINGRIELESAIMQVVDADETVPKDREGYTSGIAVNGIVCTEEGMNVYAEWYAYDYSSYDPDAMGDIEGDAEYEYNQEDVSTEVDTIDKFFVLNYDNNNNFLGIKEVVYDFIPDEYVQDTISDGQGHIAIVGSHSVVFTDLDLNVLQKVYITDNWINNCFVGDDGDIYVFYYTDNWDLTCGKINPNSSSVADGINLKDTYANGYFMSATDKNILYHFDSTSFKATNITDNEDEEIFKWIKIDIEGNNVTKMCEGKDGCFYACVRDWSANDSQIAKIYQVKNSEIVTKTEIRLASIYGSDSNMEAAIVAYNKSQDKYRIVTETYYDWQTDGESMEDALVNLNNAITGSSAPDIICLEGLEVRSLVNKGVLEDISGYIANSSTIKLEDYNKTVIDAFTIDGKLISIPRSFNLMTMVVNSNNFPAGKDGWTLSEMIDYIYANPGADLEAYILRSEFLDTYVGCSLSEYIDWSTGTVDFNKDSLRKALEYAATLPEEIDWNNIDPNFSFSESLSNGKILGMRTYLSACDDVQMINAYFRVGTKYIGMPNPEGKNVQIMTTDTGYAISANSENKEAAWDFIEFYLNRERSDWDYAFPSKNSDLQAMFDKELEHAGQPNGSMMVDDTGWEYEFHYSTQEEIDQIQALIDAAVAVDSDPDIMSIIEEEASGYFSGQKSLDDVITLIQSRVQIYVSERM